MWYPQDKKKLNKILNNFLSQEQTIVLKSNQKIHGLIVPHAGYIYSGNIAGKAYNLLKRKQIKKIIILAPSHYESFSGLVSSTKLSTILGSIKVTKNNFPKNNNLVIKEHSLDNQLPFIQKVLPKAKILPFVVGNIKPSEAEKIAKKLNKFIDNKTIVIVSTDLSHFNQYLNAINKDKNTIKIIENIDLDKINELDACGKFPLLIFFYLAKLNNWKPKLIEYKNSGDITGEGSSVVGYASFYF